MSGRAACVGVRLCELPTLWRAFMGDFEHEWDDFNLLEVHLRPTCWANHTNASPACFNQGQNDSVKREGESAISFLVIWVRLTPYCSLTCYAERLRCYCFSQRRVHVYRVTIMLTSLFSEAPQLLLLNQKSSDALFSLKCWHHSLYISFFFSKGKHDILKHVCCFPAKYGNVAQIAAWRSTRGTPWIEVKWKLRCVGGGRVVHVCRDAQLIVVLLWAVGIFLIVAEF